MSPKNELGKVRELGNGLFLCCLFRSAGKGAKKARVYRNYNINFDIISIARAFSFFERSDFDGEVH